jgi:hypothetical protein
MLMDVRALLMNKRGERERAPPTARMDARAYHPRETADGCEIGIATDVEDRQCTTHALLMDVKAPNASACTSHC